MEVDIDGRKYNVPPPAKIGVNNGELYINGEVFDPEKFTEIK